MRPRRARAMVACAWVALVAPIAAQQARDNARTVPPKGTAEISGVVVSDDFAARPLSRAQVIIVGTESGFFKMLMTDENGRFDAVDLPAGRYILGAAKPRYVGTFFGASRAGRPGTAIQLADGQHLADMTFKLMLGGTISGSVTDERGQPVPGATVRLMQFHSSNGPPTLSFADAAAETLPTDDRGGYRLYGLAPGTYAVSILPAVPGGRDIHLLTANDVQSGLDALAPPPPGETPPPVTPPRPPASTVLNSTRAPAAPTDTLPNDPRVAALEMAGLFGNSGTVGYAPVYYPGTVDITNAARVTVAQGEERAGIDVKLELVPTARIDGTVVNDDGSPAAGSQVTISLPDQTPDRSSLGPLAAMLPLFLSAANASSVRPDGRFSLGGIAPGHYTIMARTHASLGMGRGGTRGTSDQAASRWAIATLDVNGQNISDLVLRLQPGLTITGRVRFNGVSTTPPKDYSEVEIIATSAADAGGLPLAESARVREDGTFTVGGLAPGKYTMLASLNGPEMLTWTASSIVIGGQDHLDLPIDLKAGDAAPDALVTLTDRQQEVSGTLQDAKGRPASQYTIVLFPSDTRYWTSDSRRVLVARPGTDGHFEFRGPLGPPPGEYFLAAVTDLEPDAEHDPDVLSALAKGAVRVSVAAGGKTVQDLRVGG